MITAVLIGAAAVPLQMLHDAHGAWKQAFEPTAWILALLALLIASRITALFDRR